MLEGVGKSQNSRNIPFAGAARRILRFGALRGMRSIEVDPEMFRRELSEKHGLWVPSLARLKEVPVEHLDAVAAKLIRDAERLALVEGAGLGLGGLITFLPDASFLTIITLRLIQRLGGSIEASPIPVRGGERSLRVRAGYCAVPDFAESPVDAVELLLRATTALRDLVRDGDAEQVRAFEPAPLSYPT